ncbi:SMP-30/gluconolactonase/LRE family protein [Phycisphaeraceae bacterium D3-23]
MRPLAALLAVSLLASFAAPAAAQLIPEDAAPEKVANGYQFTEGPAAGPDGCIYFTDIPAELILKYDPATGETETVVEESGAANGLMWDTRIDDVLIACRHRGRDVAAYYNDLSQLSPGVEQHEDDRLNSPNDLDLDQEGNVYFTDPRYGNRDSMEMDIEGVYFVSRDPDTDQVDRMVRIIDDLTRPNGIVLSPDESILYVADNGTNEIFAYDITAPGEIENKRLFARLNEGRGGGPDGMCVDAQGRLYAAGQGRVWVYNPDGSAAGSINVGSACTNCTFAADGKTLYITANRGLYRIELETETALPVEEDE